MSSFLVAIVEDDQSVLVALQSLLETAGYEVLLYSCAEDLLSSARLRDLDCLVSDIGLPGMSGIELLRAIHSSRPGLPVILVTAHHDPNLRQAALDAGARRVFLKPLKSTELLDALAEAR